MLVPTDNSALPDRRLIAKADERLPPPPRSSHGRAQNEMSALTQREWSSCLRRAARRVDQRGGIDELDEARAGLQSFPQRAAADDVGGVAPFVGLQASHTRGTRTS